MPGANPQRLHSEDQDFDSLADFLIAGVLEIRPELQADVSNFLRPGDDRPWCDRVLGNDAAKARDGGVPLTRKPVDRGAEAFLQSQQFLQSRVLLGRQFRQAPIKLEHPAIVSRVGSLGTLPGMPDQRDHVLRQTCSIRQALSPQQVEVCLPPL